jgi:hypothetical protein
LAVELEGASSSSDEDIEDVDTEWEAHEQYLPMAARAL